MNDLLSAHPLNPCLLKQAMGDGLGLYPSQNTNIVSCLIVLIAKRVQNRIVAHLGVETVMASYLKGLTVQLN